MSEISYESFMTYDDVNINQFPSAETISTCSKKTYLDTYSNKIRKCIIESIEQGKNWTEVEFPINSKIIDEVEEILINKGYNVCIDRYEQKKIQISW